MPLCVLQFGTLLNRQPEIFVPPEKKILDVFNATLDVTHFLEYGPTTTMRLFECPKVVIAVPPFLATHLHSMFQPF